VHPLDDPFEDDVKQFVEVVRAVCSMPEKYKDRNAVTKAGRYVLKQWGGGWVTNRVVHVTVDGEEYEIAPHWWHGATVRKVSRYIFEAKKK